MSRDNVIFHCKLYFAEFSQYAKLKVCMGRLDFVALRGREEGGG